MCVCVGGEYRGEESIEKRGGKGEGEEERNFSWKVCIFRKRKNLVRQGILKEEYSGNGPRLCVGYTWYHPIKPAHMADFHIQNADRGKSAALSGSPTPKPTQKAAYGLLDVCM